MASNALYGEIQELAARYPEPRSAVMPALRLAQERYGWLSPDAIREVARTAREQPYRVAERTDLYHRSAAKPKWLALIDELALVGARG